VKFKLDENLPASSTAILTGVGHDVDTVADEGLTGAPDQDVVTTATAAGRILISLDRGLGDIRTYPPGSHTGIVVLRLTDQSAASVSQAISDLTDLTNLESLAGAVAVLQTRTAANPPSLTGARNSGATSRWIPTLRGRTAPPTALVTADMHAGNEDWMCPFKG
jgi:predicted nuclease of predicted toxin-antitoxin system